MKITYSVNDLGLGLDKNDVFGIRVSLCNLKSGVYVNKGNPLLFVEKDGIIHKFFSPVSGTITNIYVKALGFVNIEDGNQPLITIDTTSLVENSSNAVVPPPFKDRQNSSSSLVKSKKKFYYDSAVDGYDDYQDQEGCVDTNYCHQEDTQLVYDTDQVCQECFRYCDEACKRCIKDNVNCFAQPFYSESEDFVEHEDVLPSPLGYSKMGNRNLLPREESSHFSSSVSSEPFKANAAFANHDYVPSYRADDERVVNYDRWKNSNKYGKGFKFLSKKKRF